jgi:hypothetical protein
LSRKVNLSETAPADNGEPAGTTFDPAHLEATSQTDGQAPAAAPAVSVRIATDDVFTRGHLGVAPGRRGQAAPPGRPRGARPELTRAQSPSRR